MDTDPENVAKVREHLQSRGLYGPVSVDTFDGRRLPYAENLVNLIVAEDLPADVASDPWRWRRDVHLVGRDPIVLRRQHAIPVVLPDIVPRCGEPQQDEHRQHLSDLRRKSEATVRAQLDGLDPDLVISGSLSVETRQLNGC